LLFKSQRDGGKRGANFVPPCKRKAFVREGRGIFFWSGVEGGKINGVTSNLPQWGRDTAIHNGGGGGGGRKKGGKLGAPGFLHTRRGQPPQKK